MEKFLYIEGGYLILAAVILLVTLFVTTRPFMGRGAVKKGMIGVGLVLALSIGAHYWVTMSRMAEVKAAFEAGQPVLCENRIIRKGAQFQEIRKELGWRLEGDDFVNDDFARPFFTARCIVEK